MRGRLLALWLVLAGHATAKKTGIASSDHWGGHYVVRGSRRECYKCHLPKGQCFDGNVVQLGSPTHRVVQRQPPPTDGGAKRIQQLEAELRRLKQGPTAMASSGTASTSVDNQELAKLESEVKQLKTMAKEVNGLEGIIAEKEKCVAALRSQQLQAKPGSVRLRQLEGEFKRKQSQLHGVDIRKQKALERIEAEKKVFEKLQAEAVELQAQLAALQADTAKLAEEIQQESEPRPKGNAADSSHGTLHEGAQPIDIDVEEAENMAAQLGIEGGGKRLWDAMLAASTAKRIRTGKPPG